MTAARASAIVPANGAVGAKSSSARPGQSGLVDCGRKRADRNPRPPEVASGTWAVPDLSQRRAGRGREMWVLFAVYQAICQLAGVGVDAAGTPRNGSASRMPSPRRPARSRLPPGRLDLAVAAFLLKLLISAFFVRDRPGRASPRKSKKASDFPRATRRAQRHPTPPDASSSSCWIPGRSPKARPLGFAWAACARASSSV